METATRSDDRTAGAVEPCEYGAVSEYHRRLTAVPSQYHAIPSRRDRTQAARSTGLSGVRRTLPVTHASAKTCGSSCPYPAGRKPTCAPYGTPALHGLCTPLFPPAPAALRRVFRCSALPQGAPCPRSTSSSPKRRNTWLPGSRSQGRCRVRTRAAFVGEKLTCAGIPERLRALLEELLPAVHGAEEGAHLESASRLASLGISRG